MKMQTKAYICILIILIQNISVILLFNKSLVNSLENCIKNYNYPFFVIVMINILTVAGVISIYYIMRLLKNQKDSSIKLDNSKEVITALQAQKHDFRNHLNVVAGMLQLQKNDKALDYIFSISERVEEVFSISKIKNIEIAAILFRKCAIAENKGIFVDLDIRCDLQYLKMSSVDACKILFNLIDNAIYELQQCRTGYKYLMIDIFESGDYYVISIGNSYPVLSPELYDKVFEKGFTTKGNQNERGYGLSIVKRMIEKNNGKINVESFEEVGTVFTVWFPMNKPYKTTDVNVSKNITSSNA